jgi:DNA-binding NtrC family response regulator
MTQRTILIVDDEEKILKAIQRTLRNENYAIFSAIGGEEGLKLLEMREFDLVMSDQHMPGMDGVTFLKKVKTEQPQTLTIMLTGAKEISVAMEAINEAGVYKFILKPWDDDDLKVTIRRALESLDLVRERDALRERVKSRDTLLKNLEKEHPGITQVEKDADGYLILE